MSVPVWLIGLILSAQVPPPAPSTGATHALRRARQALLADETARLKTLAETLRGGGKTEPAAAVLARIEPEPAADGPSRFVPLPEIVPSRGNGKGLANVAPRADWQDDLDAIRTETGNALFALAGRAVASTPKHYALADACLRAVLDRLPDHAEARRLLGYASHEGGWATPFAIRQLKAGQVDHPVFGWVAVSWVPHLDRGELPAPSAPGSRKVDWLPAAEADARHARIESAWKIPTEHFLIQSNVPLSETIAFARRLEAFHDLFFALLADLVATGPSASLPLARRFQDKGLVGDPKSDPHLIHYFASKDEYVAYLEPIEGPSIAQSLGLYVPPKPGRGKRTPAYFYRDPNGQLDATATLYHEVSHQLLFESAGPNAYLKNVGNYWVFEGLGTYFETLTVAPDGSLSIGGLAGPRIASARARLENGEFVPIEQLVALDQDGFNRRESIHLHYAESMALAVFLMQAHRGDYRDAFLDYVKDAYRGRLKRDVGRSLQDRLGVPYPTLDAQFLEFLKAG